MKQQQQSTKPKGRYITIQIPIADVPPQSYVPTVMNVNCTLDQGEGVAFAMIHAGLRGEVLGSTYVDSWGRALRWILSEAARQLKQG